MSGMWRKLKKTLSHNTSARPSSSLVPDQSESRSPTSLSSRFSRSLSSSTRSSKKTCAICLGIVRTGQGQAIFTAECSHSFHFSCIASSVKHGNYLCPICRSKWKEIPFQLPNADADFDHNVAGQLRVSPYRAPFEDLLPNQPRVFLPPSPTEPEPFHYSDDEPLLVVSADSTSCTSGPPPNSLTVKAIPEFPAVAAPLSVSDFAVLVGVRAPTILDDSRLVDRAPIDLVMVLDVSGSMAGSKLVLMKHAVCFVVENLGPADRLSLVSFSSSASRIFPLRRMTDTGREDARLAVSSLASDGGTNIVEGLKKGTRVLEQRRERNSVASIILLSDGKDTYNRDNIAINRGRQNRNSSDSTQLLAYLNLLPVSICPQNREPQNEGQLPAFPVHTFGFGADHDSSIMHAISDASSGTFSFIETLGTIQDAFARCIGGLLSVFAQELRLTFAAASPGVEIGSIPSGRYASGISELGLQGVINIGDLYADEEKEFLVNLSIPACPIEEREEGVEITSVLKIACTYRDTVSKAMVQMEDVIVELLRPNILSPTDVILSLEVDRQRNRLWVAESIAEAREMADAGNLEGAQAVLTNRISTLVSSASAQAGDGLCSLLEAELMEIRERMANLEIYENAGRSYVLSGLSSHSWQRATTRGDSSNSGSVGYDTPSMVSMVSKSQNLSSLNPPEQVRQYSKSTTLTKM